MRKKRNELLKQSDFVILLTPLAPETKGLIGKRELNLMKETEFRKRCIVDEQALYEALVSKKIWAAGLDVFEMERVPADHPLLTLLMSLCASILRFFPAGSRIIGSSGTNEFTARSIKLGYPTVLIKLSLIPYL